MKFSQPSLVVFIVFVKHQSCASIQHFTDVIIILFVVETLKLWSDCLPDVRDSDQTHQQFLLILHEQKFNHFVGHWSSSVENVFGDKSVISLQRLLQHDIVELAPFHRGLKLGQLQKDVLLCEQ